MGALIFHVDDLLTSSDLKNVEFAKALKYLKGAFYFGKWKVLEGKEKIVYCGGVLESNDEGEVMLSYGDYIRRAMLITVKKGENSTRELDIREVSKVRALIGALQWLANQGTPPLAASMSGCLNVAACGGCQQGDGEPHS